MKKIQEAQIAFKVWENIAELETILWDRYYKEFLQLMIDQDKAEPLIQNTQDFIF
jgi:hypothetical protein